MTGIVQLRIFARDHARARAFYAHVFGWQLADTRKYCWIVTADDDPRLGTDGPGLPRPSINDKIAIPTIHIGDIDATLAAAQEAGGEILVPRTPLPATGWLAYLADTEGNIIGVMQDDPAADWPHRPAPSLQPAAEHAAEPPTSPPPR